MKKTLCILTTLLAVSSTAYAATEITNKKVASMKEKNGSISVNVKNGTFMEAMDALSKEADKKGAMYFYITSLERSGMGSDIRATATIHN